LALALELGFLRLGKRIQSNFAANIEAHVVVLESFEAYSDKGHFGRRLFFAFIATHAI
jgi:hypothetical protein